MGLYTRQGVKLLSPGTILTEPMCRMITQSKWGDLFLASSASDLAEASILASTSPPAHGSIASADLITLGGTLAIQAGESIEPHHEHAYELGAYVGLNEREDQRLRTARMKIADHYVAALEEEWRRIPLRVRSGRTPEWAAPSGARRAEWPDEPRIALFRAERLRRFERTFARIISGLPVNLGEATSIIEELLTLSRQHPERFTQLALLTPRGDDYLPDHCYAVACLSIAMASRLAWPDQHIRLAGLAGLLADVGMGFVPASLRISGRPLSEVEINRVRRHPTFSVVLLEAVEGLPEEVRLAAYQHHERDNGSGYPRSLRARAISDIAKVVGIADTFAAAASRRRYRTTKRPYDAMEEIIMLASSGVFDRRAARALVESTGLFPVGSHVLLSNNTPAVVVGWWPSCGCSWWSRRRGGRGWRSGCWRLA